MKALPARFQEAWHEAKADKDGKVRFCVRPLSNRIRSHIQSASVSYNKADGVWEQRVDGGGASYDTVGFGLVGFIGLDDAETGEPLELKTLPVKIGKVTVERVTDECLDRLPPFLYQEIEATINIASISTVDEVENVNFTQPSSPETTSTIAENAPEMSGPAPTDASTDSQWPGG